MLMLTSGNGCERAFFCMCERNEVLGVCVCVCMDMGRAGMVFGE